MEVESEAVVESVPEAVLRTETVLRAEAALRTEAALRAEAVVRTEDVLRTEGELRVRVAAVPRLSVGVRRMPPNTEPFCSRSGRVCSLCCDKAIYLLVTNI